MYELVDREIDWVIKQTLIERYRDKHDLALSSPRVAQLDLSYHDINRERGLYYLLDRRDQVARVTRDLAVYEAKSVPPQTTRARLRGEFIKPRAGQAAATSPSTGCTSSSTTRPSAPCCARTPSAPSTSGSTSSCQSM